MDIRQMLKRGDMAQKTRWENTRIVMDAVDREWCSECQRPGRQLWAEEQSVVTGEPGGCGFREPREQIFSH